jgi:hypothetical protein
MSLFLGIMGAGLAIVGWVMLLIEAFGKGLAWGLGCLLLPIVMPVFCVVYWSETKRASGVTGVGLILLYFAMKG